jgi:hypothetical protein
MAHRTPNASAQSLRTESHAWRRRAATARAIVDILEPRQMLAADAFSGSGAWTDASHWSTGAVPAFGDTATIPAGATVTVSALQDVDSITNAGTIDFTTDAATFNLGNDASLTNTGTIEKTGGTGTTVILPGNQGSTLVDTGGTLSAQTGTLSIQATAHLSGTTLATVAGASFAFDQVSTATPGAYSNETDLAGALTGTGGGTVLFRTGFMYNVRTTAANDATPTATLSFPAGMAQVTGFGFETYGSDAQIVNAGELDYVGSAAHGDVNVDNAGTIINKGTTDIVNGDQTTLLNDTTGVIDLTTDAGLSYLANGHGGNLTFTNKGIIEKTGGTGTSTVALPTTNAGGQFIADTGNLELTGGGSAFVWTFGGITAPAGSAVILNDPNENVYMSGTFAVTGGGTFEYAGGEMYGPNSDDGQDASTPANLAFAPGTFQLRGGNFDDETNLFNSGEVDMAGANNLSYLDNRGTVLITDAGPVTSIYGFLNDTTGLLNFQADATVTDGYHAYITNKGTILKSGGTGTLDLSNNSFDNTGGKVESASGTIKLKNYGSTLPAGQTFQADPGGTITTADNAITDIEGTAILTGAGATIPAIAGVTTVGGDLSVLSGATFTTAGDLAVTGTLTVGGHVTVAGALAQTGTLGFAVAAASGTAGAPLLTVAGATSLAGTLTTSVTSDITITAGTTYTVATFASPATGAFLITTASNFTPVVTTTSIVLNSSATPTPTPTPTGTLVPTITKSTVPTSVIGTVKHTGRVTVSVTSTATANSTAKDTITVYATTDGVIDANSLVLTTLSKKLTFKPGKPVMFNLPTIQTQNLPAGDYTMLAQTTDATGLLTVSAAGPSLVVVPPVVRFAATVGAVAPKKARAGKKASVVVTLANAGNVDSTAAVTFAVGLSADGTTAVAIPLAVASATRKVKVVATGKPTKVTLTFTLPADLTATAYYPVVSITGTASTVNPATTVAVGPAFTPVVSGLIR